MITHVSVQPCLNMLSNTHFTYVSRTLEPTYSISKSTPPSITFYPQQAAIQLFDNDRNRILNNISELQVECQYFQLRFDIGGARISTVRTMQQRVYIDRPELQSSLSLSLSRTDFPRHVLPIVSLLAVGR